MTTNTSTALITGGTSGIGRAVAGKLAQLGIHVLVVGRNAERGKKTVDEIRAARGKAELSEADSVIPARPIFDSDLTAGEPRDEDKVWFYWRDHKNSDSP